MAIQLVTLGGLHATSDDGELDWLLGQHSRAALFVYLAVERRVSREALIALFWPESDAENARHALRQSLYHLRKAVGGEWIDSRAHELVISGDVRTDVGAFSDALDRGDGATATRLYRGPFLDGVHLVDLKPWESWVDSRRSHYARAFRKACRDLIETKRATGDLAAAVQAAEQWAHRDAFDGEAQHRLIETLAAAGERAEAIRQYETYLRLLKPDGLQPLDETVALADRLRAEAVSLPALRAETTVAETPRRDGAVLGASPEAVRVTGALPASRRRWAIVVASVIAALGVGWAVTRTIARPAPADPTTIAVLPFVVHRGETADYLGDGIVNLLGTALDGSGSLRAVDARAVFAAVSEAGSNATNRDEADRLAQRLGAGVFVVGDVVEAAGQLQIAAAAYRTAAACATLGSAGDRTGCRGEDPAVKATVSGPADSVFVLVDRLAARLLGGLGEADPDRLVRTASLTTTSLAAFKSYLQGEGLMRAGRFEQAADAYLGAIGLDSTFALAHYRLALAREWAPLPGEDASAAAAARFGQRLSSRDRNRLEAFRLWRAGDAAEAERAYRSILARYPDDIDAWFQLGEILFHHGPLFGRTIGESEEAWRKVLSYEPQSLFAITHLARIALVERREGMLDTLLAPFRPGELRTDRRLTELALLRAVARADTATARSLAADVRRWEPFAVWRIAVFLTAFTSDPARMRSVMSDLSVQFPSPAQRADLEWFASLLELSRGRVDSARAALARAIEAERTAAAERRRWGFAETTEWFAATLPLPYPDSTLKRLRLEASRPVTPQPRAPFAGEMGIGSPIQLEPVRQYTLGVLSWRLRDTTSASAAATALQRLAASNGANALTRDLDRGLRARLAWAAGRPNDALRLLEAMESRDSQGDVAATPFVSRANERYLRGQLLASLGRHEEALRWFASLGDGSVTEVPFQALSCMGQATILERLGQTGRAADQYRRALALLENADPLMRATVDSARRRLASLAPRI